ncbi:MAG: NYN domain-containing protein [Fibrobacter sp.]|nr:NYN domain-containing protein [Fibrobacter sp.]
MPSNAPLRIGFFVDGFTLKKVNEYYRFFHPYHTRVDFRGLKFWARREALKLFSPGRNYCTMECHYYHPYKKTSSVCFGDYGMNNFERELRHVGFNVHYAEGHGENHYMPNLMLLEDAIMLANFGRLDVAVLLTTQGQLSPFPEKLKIYGVRTLLLGWNFAYPRADRWINWKTDMNLRETCDYYVAMDQVANKNPPVGEGYTGLFRKQEVRACRPACVAIRSGISR